MREIKLKVPSTGTDSFLSLYTSSNRKTTLNIFHSWCNELKKCTPVQLFTSAFIFRLQVFPKIVVKLKINNICTLYIHPFSHQKALKEFPLISNHSLLLVLFGYKKDANFTTLYHQLKTKNYILFLYKYSLLHYLNNLRVPTG